MLSTISDTGIERKINGTKLSKKKKHTNTDGDSTYDNICILNLWGKDGLVGEWI